MLLIYFNILFLSLTSYAQGPLYKDESKIIFIQGKEAFDNEKFSEAVFHFKNLTQKYPASVEGIEGLRYLGLSYIEENLPKKAIEPLKNFINIRRENPIHTEAKINLSRAYLDSKKYHEALLLLNSALEVKPLPEPVRLSSLSHKAEALLRLKQITAAEQALDSVLEASKPYPEIRSHALLVQLQTTHAKCASLPSQTTKDEAQAREQIMNRFHCWSESTIIYKNILSIGIQDWAGKAQIDMQRSLDSFFKVLENPPKPIGKRTQEEFKRYKDELVLVLKKDIKPKAQETLSMIQTWIKSNSAFQEFQKIKDSLEKRISKP